MATHLSYFETPVTELLSAVFRSVDVQVFIKRENLNHETVSGNKWWKLKYNLEEAQLQKHTTLLTFGGGFSNHLYATAAAANQLGLKSIGVVRGEETLPLNNTLSFAHQCGMQLHFVSREDYRKKTEPSFINEWHDRFGDFYIIPEGGTNELALKGCAELGEKLQKEIEFDYLCLSVGTGGTMAGLINGVSDKKIVGYASLKGGNFLEVDVKKFTRNKSNWKIETGYHFGGYGKVNDELKTFMLSFEKEHEILLDPVYTAKAMYGLFDQVAKGIFQRGSKILFLHTGGLQGRAGFNF
jgi:1-aminocyclopropane-1-carboxylate deaminase